jgi:predicted dehydrogenase
MVRLKQNEGGLSKGPQFLAESGGSDASDALEMELKSFIEAVRTRSRPLVGGEDGKKALAMALQINQEIKIAQSAHPQEVFAGLSGEQVDLPAQDPHL